jgi:hypothetical protein
VALAVLKGEMTLAQLAEHFDVYQPSGVPVMGSKSK